MGAMSKVSRAQAVQLWKDLSRAHSTMSAALEKDMQPEAGMPLAWYEVLQHLSHAAQGLMRYQDLAKVAGITDSGASRPSSRCQSRPHRPQVLPDRPARSLCTYHPGRQDWIREGARGFPAQPRPQLFAPPQIRRSGAHGRSVGRGSPS